MDLPQIEGSAPANTPLGLLERGRGAGWILASHSESGAELLLACLSREPRWDHQVEDREDYYATLALNLRVSARLLGPASSSVEDSWIVVGVLRSMARRGAAGAAEMLLEFEQQTAVETGNPHAAPSVQRGLNKQALLQAPIEELLVLRTPTFPKAVLHRLRTTTDQKEIDALREAAHDASGPGWRLALQALGSRGDTTPIRTIEEILASDRPGATRAAAFRYIRALPGDLALPLAREWLDNTDGRGAVAAAILADHAEPRDEAAVRSKLADAADYYTISSLVQALARLPGAGPFPELEEVYLGSSYSFARARAVEAMAATDPNFSEKWAEECLWDCEPAARAQGARWSPKSSSAVTRLQELADESLEDSDVREAALTRVT